MSSPVSSKGVTHAAHDRHLYIPARFGYVIVINQTHLHESCLVRCNTLCARPVAQHWVPPAMPQTSRVCIITCQYFHLRCCVPDLCACVRCAGQCLMYWYVCDMESVIHLTSLMSPTFKILKTDTASFNNRLECLDYVDKHCSWGGMIAWQCIWQYVKNSITNTTVCT